MNKLKKKLNKNSLSQEYKALLGCLGAKWLHSLTLLWRPGFRWFGSISNLVGCFKASFRCWGQIDGPVKQYPFQIEPSFHNENLLCPMCFQDGSHGESFQLLGLSTTIGKNFGQ